MFLKFLSAWTGLNCTGKVVNIAGNAGFCESMEGVEEQVLSWSDDTKPFGES